MSKERLSFVLLSALSGFGLLFLLFLCYTSIRPCFFRFSPDGRYLARCSVPVFGKINRWPGYLSVKDLEKGEIIRPLDEPLEYWFDYGGVQWARTGPGRLAKLPYGANDDRFWLWDPAAGSTLKIGPVNLPLFYWLRDGKHVIFSDGGERNTESLAYWKIGLAEPIPVPTPFEGFHVGAQSMIPPDLWVVVSRGKSADRARFFAARLDGQPTFSEITDRLPPFNYVTDFEVDPTYPDLVVVQQMAPSRLSLVRFDSKEILRCWKDIGPWGFTGEGRTLHIQHEDYTDGPQACKRISLPDLSETPLFEGQKGRLLVEPEGRWVGLLKKVGKSEMDWSRLRISGGPADPCPGFDFHQPVSHVFMFLSGFGPWIGEPGDFRLSLVTLKGGFPSPCTFNPLSGAVHTLDVPLDYSLLGNRQMVWFWLILTGFLLNSGLFAALSFGAGISSPARLLGAFFWSFSFACVAVDLPSLIRNSRNGQGWFGLSFWVTISLGTLLTLGSFSALPFALLRFATEFPKPNPYAVRCPRTIRIARTLTGALPFLVSGSFGLGLLLNFANWQSDSTVIGEIVAWVATVIVGLVALVILVASIVAVVHNYRFAPDSKAKGQLKYIALGLGGFLAWAVILGPIPFMILGQQSPLRQFFLYLYFGLLMAIPGATCGYALLAHNLLDVSFIIRRTAKYAIVMVSLGALFIGTIVIVGLVLQGILGWKSHAGTALATLVSVLAFQPLKTRVQDWVDRRFDRVRYDAKRTLSDLASKLSSMGSVGEVATTLEEACRDSLKVGESRLFLRRGDGWSGDAGYRPAAPESVDATPQNFASAEDALKRENPWIRLALPIRGGDKLFAVLGVGEKLSQERFSSEDMDLLKLLARGAGLAFQNSRLVQEAARGEILRRDLEEARAIQQRYFPKSLPEVGGYSLAVSNTPARIVGGDYYDALALPDGRLALFIADVSGKGMPAALRVAEIRSYLHAILKGTCDPAEVMGQLNGHLCASGHKNEFTTALLGVLDPPSGTFHFSNAGHVPPLVVFERSEARFVMGEDSLPLGIAPEILYGAREASLCPRDFLVLMTDGLPEVKDPAGRLLSFEEIEKAGSGLPKDSAPEQVGAALLALAHSFADGTPFEDDVTLVVIKRDGH